MDKITFGKDGRCECNCGTTCPLGRTGMYERCFAHELEDFFALKREDIRFNETIEKAQAKLDEEREIRWAKLMRNYGPISLVEADRPE